MFLLKTFCLIKNNIILVIQGLFVHLLSEIIFCFIQTIIQPKWSELENVILEMNHCKD